MQLKPFIIAKLISSGRALTMALGLAWPVASGFASTYYVAPNGADTNSGGSNSPYATITRAQTAAAAGDTVYLRGGTYFLNDAHLTYTNSAWAVVNRINKSGISYLAYPGERPVFDFTDVKPAGGA
jgi:hypothetical protein